MNENVTVCITPKGDKPILHFSQFDNERVFTVTVLADDGESAAVLTGLDIEFRLRKTDSHVVTIAPESVADNVITFKTTEQLCACCGQNIASVVLMKDDMIISTLDILVDIQRDILSGGLISESDIRNLTTQIEQIVPEVVGENYYDKSEVDELIAEHTFDPTNYYDKQEVDELIAEHTFDPTNYYDKSDVDSLLSDKADSADVYTKTETDNLLADKADKSAIASLIVQKDVHKAPIASFNTDLNDNLTKCIVDINPVQSGNGTPSPQNVRPISGFSGATIVRCGVNLLQKSFDYFSSVPDNVSSCFYIKAGTYTFSFASSTATNWRIGIKCKDLSGNDLSDNAHKPEQYLTWNTANKMWLQGSNNTNKTITVNFVDDCYIRFVFALGDTSASSTFADAILNVGSSASTYEPYNGQTAIVNFGQTVYGGSLDVTSGKLTIDTLYKTYNGSENWQAGTAQSGNYRIILDEVLDNVVYPTLTSEDLDCICNMFVKSNAEDTYRLVNGISYQPNYGLRIYSSSYNTSDITLWKTLLASTPLQVVYHLATSLTVQLSPNQIEAIVGQNNVYADTNGDTAVRFTETIGNELGV